MLVGTSAGFTNLGSVSTVSLGPGEIAVLVVSNAGDDRAKIGYHATTTPGNCP